MSEQWPRWLQRWADAGLIDATTAERIREFEREQPHATHLAWPIRVALVFGGLMLGAGVLLFVAAQWDSLGPTPRFLLLLALTAVFHVAGGVAVTRFRSLATTLHALGSVALGAAIFLAGQIFNLEEHWADGFMLWALGAAIAYYLLRDEPQLALVSILAPAWLVAEWAVATSNSGVTDIEAGKVALSGLFLLSLAYFSAPESRRLDRRRWVLAWTGGVALLPFSLALAFVAPDWSVRPGSATPLLPLELRIVGWLAATLIPLGVSFAFRGRRAWPVALAAGWVIVLLAAGRAGIQLLQYPLWGLFAIGLVLWGIREARGERINAGAAIFAATVLAFYFSEVMDKLGRSASLIGFGLLFLAGGIALERVRRRLIAQMRAVQA